MTRCVAITINLTIYIYIFGKYDISINYITRAKFFFYSALVFFFGVPSSRCLSLSRAHSSKAFNRIFDLVRWAIWIYEQNDKPSNESMILFFFFCAHQRISVYYCRLNLYSQVFFFAGFSRGCLKAFSWRNHRVWFILLNISYVKVRKERVVATW